MEGTTQPNGRPVAGATASERSTSDFDEKLKPFDRATLEVMLRALSARLGTAEEAPGDLEFTRAIAHRINNLAVADVFRTDDTSGRPPS